MTPSEFLRHRPPHRVGERYHHVDRLIYKCLINLGNNWRVLHLCGNRRDIRRSMKKVADRLTTLEIDFIISEHEHIIRIQDLIIYFRSNDQQTGWTEEK